MSQPVESHDTHSPQEAINLLKAGNERWVGGAVQRPAASIERRQSLTRSQAPFTVVVSCIDSRVPPELIFDRGLGDLLVVRSAAHSLDNIVIGSVEYGPCALHVPLIVVLGHQRCGAVAAAAEAFGHDHWPPGHIANVVEALRPAYEVAMEEPGDDLVDKMVRAHTMLTVANLRSQELFTELLSTDKLCIVGGRYDLESGAVAFTSEPSTTSSSVGSREAA